LLSLFVFTVSAQAQSPLTEQPAASPTEAAIQPAHRTYVELYVNSKDAKHVSRVLSKVISIRKKNQLDIPAVFHIGDYHTVTPEFVGQLGALNTRVYPLERIPSDLPITTSPAWVIVTSSGRYIVEGILGINRLVDENGEFIEPSKVKPESADELATPTPSMQGF
jgi:hypothetical protein